MAFRFLVAAAFVLNASDIVVSAVVHDGLDFSAAVHDWPDFLAVIHDAFDRGAAEHDILSAHDVVIAISVSIIHYINLPSIHS